MGEVCLPAVEEHVQLVVVRLLADLGDRGRGSRYQPLQMSAAPTVNKGRLCGGRSVKSLCWSTLAATRMVRMIRMVRIIR